MFHGRMCRSASKPPLVAVQVRRKSLRTFQHFVGCTSPRGRPGLRCMKRNKRPQQESVRYKPQSKNFGVGDHSWRKPGHSLPIVVVSHLITGFGKRDFEFSSRARYLLESLGDGLGYLSSKSLRALGRQWGRGRKEEVRTLKLCNNILGDRGKEQS